MFDLLNFSYPSNSGHEFSPRSEIDKLAKTVSYARNNIVEGISIDRSDTSENENASDSMRIKCEFDSNVIDERYLQCDRHVEPRISTLLGMKMDRSNEPANADDSIRINREFDSNGIDQNEQFEKQDEPRISTLFGIKID
jgi:hypothetical protein